MASPVMSDSQQHFLLNDLLREVSRSFYLTLRILPAGMREPMSVAYLLARAADTIADTTLIEAESRISLLVQLQDVLQSEKGVEALQDDLSALIDHQQNSYEQLLLRRLSAVMGLLNELDDEDRQQVVAVVMTLTSGMLWDMQYFPSESSGEVKALVDDKALDRYTYMVAGCVGEFWSNVSFSHDKRLLKWDLPAQRELGVRFGKALQLTNILRDIPEDLRIGRCYFPQQALNALNLDAEALLDVQSYSQFQPIHHYWLSVALEHYRAAQQYIENIPRRCYMLRLGCLWSLMIGLKTLQCLIDEERVLDPSTRIKITRANVYRLILTSLPMALSHHMTKRWLTRNIQKIADNLRY